MARSFEIRIDGCRSADAPATYAQCGVWWATEWMWDDDAYFNLGWCVPIPAGAQLELIAIALRRMIEQFDTFRTLFEVRNGKLWQIVTPSGSLIVDVYESAAESVEKTADTVLESLAGTAFRSESEWPLRLAVVTKNGDARLLVMAFNHLALDLRGWRIIEFTLNRLLTDVDTDLPDASGSQPVNQAAYEHSAEGQAANRAALARWKSILCSAPPTLFDFDTVQEEKKRYQVLRMESRALAVALAIVAGRSRTSNSAVLLAAVSVVFGIYSGHSEVIVQINVANRVREGSEDIAGYLCWDSLFCIDTDGLSFDAISRQSFSAALDSYQHGTYDRASARELKNLVEHELGAHIDLGCHVNDRRERTGLTAAMVRGTNPDFAALLDETRLSHVSSHNRIDTRFHVHAMDDHVGSIALEVMADTRYLPMRHVEQLLRGVEGLVVAAAPGDLAPEEMRNSIELQPVTRGAGWIRHRTGWAHLPRIQLIWSNLVGPSGAVFADPRSDGTSRLVAYYEAGRGHRCVADLHAAFVLALDERSDVRTPDFYVCFSEAPPVVHDQSAWEGCTVMEQGTGRQDTP